MGRKKNGAEVMVWGSSGAIVGKERSGQGGQEGGRGRDIKGELIKGTREAEKKVGIWGKGGERNVSNGKERS